MALMGGEAGVHLHTVEGALTARRGFRVRAAARYTPALFDVTSGYTKAYALAGVSMGGRLLTDVFLDLQLAGEKNWGTYPFFDAAFIGGTTLPVPLSFSAIAGTPLRGFDANRFAGDAAVGGNAELRIALGKFLALLPFRYGLSGVADIGRVFLAGESSSTWHNGVGGGLWIAVYAAGPGLTLASAFNFMVVKSDERTAFYFAGGFGL